MALKRINREFAELQSLLTDQESNFGPFRLKIVFEDDDAFSWIIKVTCPQYWGEDEWIHAQFRFPGDYPFKPYRMFFNNTSSHAGYYELKGLMDLNQWSPRLKALDVSRLTHG